MNATSPAATSPADLPPTTSDALINAAERLFIQKGHHATSLRDITREAGANLAAVNYHFGSKEALIQAVVKRRLSAINEARLQALDALERQADGEPLKPSQILDAFFGTLLRMATDADGKDSGVLMLLERTMTDPAAFIHTLFAHEYAPVINRFREALFVALPDVPRDEIIWRFQFMLGATSYAIVGPQALRRAAGWREAGEGKDDNAMLLPRLMSFLLGGLRAPLRTLLPTPQPIPQPIPQPTPQPHPGAQTPRQ